MAKKVKKKNSNVSARIVMVIFAIVIACLFINVIYIGSTGKHLISQNDIKAYANSRGSSQKEETIYAKRGTIYTSDNEVVASDVKK